MRPFFLILLGILIIWLGFTGRLGVVLASIFAPTGVMIDG